MAWVLERILASPLLMICVTIATIVLTVYLVILALKSQFPQQDTGRLVGGNPCGPGYVVPADACDHDRICDDCEQRSGGAEPGGVLGRGRAGKYGPHVHRAEGLQGAEDDRGPGHFAHQPGDVARGRGDAVFLRRPCRISGRGRQAIEQCTVSVHAGGGRSQRIAAMGGEGIFPQACGRFRDWPR